MLSEFLFNKPKGLFSFVITLELEKIKNKKIKKTIKMIKAVPVFLKKRLECLWLFTLD